MFQKILEWMALMQFWAVQKGELLEVGIRRITLDSDASFFCAKIDDQTGRPSTLGGHNVFWVRGCDLFWTKDDAVAELARREESRHQKRVRELKNEIKPKPESEESNAEG